MGSAWRRWASDVVGGAALGYWVTDRLEDRMRATATDRPGWHALVTLDGHREELGVRVNL